MLKRNLERAREKGFTFFVGPEMEFFYFRTGEQIEPLDTAGYFDLTAHDLGSASCASRPCSRLEAMGIPVEYSFHENGPSQHEIDLRYTDALTMADNVMTFRLVAKEVAQRPRRVRDVHAQADRGRVRLGDAHAPLAVRGRRQRVPRSRATSTACRRSRKHFIAGLLVHASEITAITNQWVNSYKRLIPGYEAPVYMCWARNNRVGARAGAAAEEGQERARRASSSARPTRRATRTSRSR